MIHGSEARDTRVLMNLHARCLTMRMRVFMVACNSYCLNHPTNQPTNTMDHSRGGTHGTPWTAVAAELTEG